MSTAAGTPTPENPFAAARFDFSAPVPPASELGHVHFLAIGGAGVSGIARIMLGRGMQVSGTDAKDVPVLAELERAGAQVWVGFDPTHVQGADTVVMSSAIREDNPELVTAREQGLPVLHRSQGLASLLHGRTAVAVAGANGKTTTSSLLTVALQAAGADPSFALGGEIASLGTNAHDGSGEIFVVEADESDGSFVVYHPHVAVVTNVQPDHLDFYGGFEVVEAAYAEFARSVRPGGLLVTCADDAGAVRLAERARDAGVRVLTYGFDPGADLVLSDLQLGASGSTATMTWSGRSATLTLGVPGRHNVLNGAAAFAACVEGLGQPEQQVLEGLGSFDGTRRRFERRGMAGGVLVIDDYAHNVGKVQAVTETAAAIAHGRGGRLIAVFQPHLYSRTRDFATGLGAGLAQADLVVVMDVYGAREEPLPGVSGRLVADAARAADPGVEVHYEPSWAAVAPLVASLSRPGDLVLTVGAGDVTGVASLVLDQLEDRSVGETGGRG